MLGPECLDASAGKVLLRSLPPSKLDFEDAGAGGSKKKRGEMVTEMMKATGNFDGACKLNPGLMGVGVVIVSGGVEIGSISKCAGEGTSSVAEWLALVTLLELAQERGVEVLEVRGDSLMVINQMTGRWKMKAEHLRQYRERARRLLSQFRQVSFKWVRRSENRRADYLAVSCLRGKRRAA